MMCGGACTRDVTLSSRRRRNWTSYDSLAEKAELANNLMLIERGVEDVKAGRVRDARAGVRELAAKHGITLGR